MDERTSRHIDRGFSALRELEVIRTRMEQDHRKLVAWCWQHVAASDVLPAQLPTELVEILDREDAHLREFERRLAEAMEIAQLLSLGTIEHLTEDRRLTE